MRKYFYINLFLFLALPYWLFGQELPRNQVFNSSNEVNINIMGGEKNYIFRSNKLAGRYDSNQKYFEFILPLHTIIPISDSIDVGVFNDLFLGNLPSSVLRLTAAFQDPLINVEDFKSPRQFTLDGWLMMNGTQYNVPVVMSIFYSNDVLYYKMKVDLNIYKLNWNIPPHYRSFLTGIVQIQVNDGRWRNYFTQVK